MKKWTPLSKYKKKRIQELKHQGLRNFEIAKKLKITTQLVGYYTNANTRKQVLERGRKRTHTKYGLMSVEQRERYKERNLAWYYRNKKKVSRQHKKHREVVKKQKYEDNKKLIVQLGKQLGLYEKNW